MSVNTSSKDASDSQNPNPQFTRLIFFPAAWLGIWMLANPWPNDSVITIAWWVAFTSYAFFCHTSCFHETAHQTFFGSRTASIWLGRFIGTLILVPYSVYRESHIRHHAYLNKPSDWELWPYSDPNQSLTFRRVFVWFDIVFGFLMAAFTYGRIYFHPNSPIRNPKFRRAIMFEYVAMTVFWGTVVGFVAAFGAWTQFVIAWVVPHFVAGIYQSVRKLTEHLGMSSYDPLLGTRTVMGSNWVTRLCTFLNFDIFVHGPHHRHPRIAHDQLTVKMDDYVTHNPNSDFPIFKSYWKAMLHAFPFVLRNPGVGMNAGAQAPDQHVEVSDFVVDVSREILTDSNLEATHLAG